MNNEELAEAIAVMQAALRGEPIKFKCRGYPYPWEDAPGKANKWDWDLFEYRVDKPLSKQPIDWSTVPVDTKIVVCLAGEKYRRHFAKFTFGKVWFFSGGKTSYSSEGELRQNCLGFAHVDQCALAEPIDESVLEVCRNMNRKDDPRFEYHSIDSLKKEELKRIKLDFENLIQELKDLRRITMLEYQSLRTFIASKDLDQIINKYEKK